MYKQKQLIKRKNEIIRTKRQKRHDLQNREKFVEKWHILLLFIVNMRQKPLIRRKKRDYNQNKKAKTTRFGPRALLLLRRKRNRDRLAKFSRDIHAPRGTRMQGRVFGHSLQHLQNLGLKKRAGVYTRNPGFLTGIFTDA